jgi:N-acetylmuramoyl-L-alanine amidase
MSLRTCFLVFLLTSSQLASASMNLQRESECLAKMIYAEARGEPEEGKVGVAYTVVHRLKNGFGKTVCGIVTSGAYYVARYIPVKVKKVYFKLAKDVVLQAIKDPVGGATHFLRKDLKRKPKWYKTNRVTAVHGMHEFLRVPKVEKQNAPIRTAGF